jgi:hypothetical protein
VEGIYSGILNVFLAVTLGFVAENFKEYLGERAK